MLARAKESMVGMASTQQKYHTLFARATVNPKEGIVERKKKMHDRMSGKREENITQRKQQKRRTRSSSHHSSLEELWQ